MKSKTGEAAEDFGRGDLTKLSDYFRDTELEWRLQSCGITSKGKPWAKALVYVTNRAIMNRLDEVVGPENWKNEFRNWKEVGGQQGQLCGISIKIGDEWVTKWDGAQCSEFEPIKGGLSDAMKRAAVQWGIGRYLYEIPGGLVETSLTSHGDDWNYAKTKDNKVFYWRAPKIENLAPQFVPDLQVKPLPPHTMDLWADTIERSQTLEPIMECLRGIVYAYRNKQLERAAARPLVQKAFDKGVEVSDVDEVIGFERAANTCMKDNLIDKDACMAGLSALRSRLNLNDPAK